MGQVTEAAAPLLTVRDLKIWAQDGARRRIITTGTDLTLGRGETIAIVGVFGSGKSLTAKAIGRLLPPWVAASGEIRFDGIDVMATTARELQRLRGRRLSLLLQDPFTMMNPLLRCGAHIEEMLRDRPEFAGRGARADEVRRRLEEVGISAEDVAHRLPFQLSGGMAQRVALAAALARDPELLIADEPSTALDVTTQAEIMRLLKRVQASRGMSLISSPMTCAWPSRPATGSMCSMPGRCWRSVLTGDVERDPLHPYSLGLLLSEPPASRRVPRLIAIRGAVPKAEDVMGICPFAPRCDWAEERCRVGTPPLVEQLPGRLGACLRRAEIAEEMRALRHRALDDEAPVAALPSDPAPIILSTRAGKDLPWPRRPAGSGAEGRGHRGGSWRERRPRGGIRLGQDHARPLPRRVGLETPGAGSIEIDGIQAADFASLAARDRTRLRRNIQMVFQDPYSTLNPKHSVRRCLFEAIRAGDAAAVADKGLVDKRI